MFFQNRIPEPFCVINLKLYKKKHFSHLTPYLNFMLYVINQRIYGIVLKYKLKNFNLAKDKQLTSCQIISKAIYCGSS